MNRSELLTHIYTHPDIRSAARMLGGRNWLDLLHTAIVAIGNKSDAELSQIKYPKHFAFIVMRNIANNPHMDYRKSELYVNVMISLDDWQIDVSEDQTAPLPEKCYADIEPFTKFCQNLAKKSKNEYTRLQADLTLTYLKETTKKKLSQREFSRMTGINYQTISQFIKEMRRQYDENSPDPEQ